MRREYVFDRKTFLVRVIYAGILAAIALLFGIYKLSVGSTMNYLWVFVCFLCMYTIYILIKFLHLNT